MRELSYWCELAWLPPGEVVAGGAGQGQRHPDRRVVTGVTVPPARGRQAGRARPFPGWPTPTPTPSTAPCAGVTQRETGTFWTWREQMYARGGTLDPDAYLALARATFAEMALAGITSSASSTTCTTGRRRPYDDPNAMGARAGPGRRARPGMRLTLLDACYLPAASAPS